MSTSHLSARLDGDGPRAEPRLRVRAPPAVLPRVSPDPVPLIRASPRTDWIEPLVPGEGVAQDTISIEPMEVYHVRRLSLRPVAPRPRDQGAAPSLAAPARRSPDRPHAAPPGVLREAA